MPLSLLFRSRGAKCRPENHSVRRHNLPEYTVLPNTCIRLDCSFKRALTMVVSTNDEVRARAIRNIRALSANACIGESSPETCSRCAKPVIVFFFLSRQLLPGMRKKVVRQSIAGSDHSPTYSRTHLFSSPFRARSRDGRGNPIDLYAGKYGRQI